MPRFTWKKQENEKGLAAVAQRPRGYDLNCGAGNPVAFVRPTYTGYGHKLAGWCFYAGGKGLPHKNTTANPLPTLAAAKAACLEWVKANYVDPASGGMD